MMAAVKNTPRVKQLTAERCDRLYAYFERLARDRVALPSATVNAVAVRLNHSCYYQCIEHLRRSGRITLLLGKQRRILRITLDSGAVVSSPMDGKADAAAPIGQAVATQAQAALLPPPTALDYAALLTRPMRTCQYRGPRVDASGECCGKPSEPRSSYCAEHKARVTAKTAPAPADEYVPIPGAAGGSAAHFAGRR